jgi:hypothetical protein
LSDDETRQDPRSAFAARAMGFVIRDETLKLPGVDL